MASPYINTILSTPVILRPDQMNNNIYINLKNNLEYKLVNKCFLNYGYVLKIIKIIEYADGVIEAENIESSALFNLKFSCRLCLPLKGMRITCEITRINKLLIMARNGPILVVITPDRINSTVFFKDNNNNIRYKKDDQNTPILLEPQDFIVVTIQSLKFFDRDEKIKAIGILDNVATDDEKKKYYSDKYREDEPIVDINAITGAQ